MLPPPAESFLMFFLLLTDIRPKSAVFKTPVIRRNQYVDESNLRTVEMMLKLHPAMPPPGKNYLMQACRWIWMANGCNEIKLVEQ